MPDSTVKEVAETFPKLTAVMVLKFVPAIVTVSPVAALDGEKEVIAGACADTLALKKEKKLKK